MAVDAGNAWNLVTGLAFVALAFPLVRRAPAHAMSFAGFGVFAAGLAGMRLLPAAADAFAWVRLVGAALVLAGGAWALVRARDALAGLVGALFLVATLWIVGFPTAQPSAAAYVLFRAGLALVTGGMLADARRDDHAIALALAAYVGYLVGTNFFETEPGRLQLGLVGAVAMLALSAALLARRAGPLVAWIPLVAVVAGMVVGALPGRPEEIGGGGFARLAAILLAWRALAPGSPVLR